MTALAEAVLLARLGDGPAAAWLRAALAGVRAAPGDLDGAAALARAFAAAGRRLARAPAASIEAGVRVAAGGPALAPGAWPAAELGRVLLLRTALDVVASLEGTAGATLVETLFRGGTLGEQRAIARALAVLPAPARFVGLGIEIVRSNASALVEAIACDNPFPAAHFPDPAFNQMVVKALFIGLPLGRVLGLEQRRTPELGRMVRAFASERRAAGRAVPPDADLLL